MGAPVKSKDGRTIGQVDEVLFGDNASRAEALYVTLKAGILRGEHVAIPFGRSLIFKDSGRSKTIIVGDDMADAMLDYAKENK